jgi:hypothetical protein
MSKEYMEKMFAWSEGKVSTKTAEHLIKDPTLTSQMSIEERASMTKHLEFRAFTSTGWTVWSR